MGSKFYFENSEKDSTKNVNDCIEMSNNEMKRMYNRVRMQRYQKEIVSDEMGAKLKDYDR